LPAIDVRYSPKSGHQPFLSTPLVQTAGDDEQSLNDRSRWRCRAWHQRGVTTQRITDFTDRKQTAQTERQRAKIRRWPPSFEIAAKILASIASVKYTLKRFRPMSAFPPRADIS
jgi:hypothetical protein